MDFNWKRNFSAICKLSDSENVKLSPFTSEFIEIYKSWMSEADLLKLTDTDEKIDVESTQFELWNDKTALVWIIQVEKEGKFVPVGDVSVFLHSWLDESEAEVDVMIGNSDFRGKGIAKAALICAMKFAHSQKNRTEFIAKINQGNAPSIRLFQKIGFSETGFDSAFNQHIFKIHIDSLTTDLNYSIIENKS
jgi:RimJ/RimL family protein N-acetyltransferase